MATETKEAISERYLIKDQEASSEAVAGVLRSTKWKSKLMKAARNWLAASSAPLAGKCWNRDGIGSGRCASSGDASDRGASFV